MFEIQAGNVHFSNGKIYHFPIEIAEAMDFEDVIIVRLVADFATASQNIFGFDHQGNLLWKMPIPRSFSPYNAYVGLFRKGDYVEALNWDGHLVTLLPKQGCIIGEDYYSGFSARTASPRHWM
jgi:hypothetical protein